MPRQLRPRAPANQSLVAPIFKGSKKGKAAKVSKPTSKAFPPNRSNIKRKRTAHPRDEPLDGTELPKFLGSEHANGGIPTENKCIQDGGPKFVDIKKENVYHEEVKGDGVEGVGPLGRMLDAKVEIKPKNKKLAYALGTTPFPGHQHPTPGEVEEVVALLTAAHGAANRPDKVPKPDNSVSGCGEVPSVLDAVIRTLLSANTSNSNSARAFAGLIEKFGLVPECAEVEGIKGRSDAGTVDWDAVRKASLDEVVKAIHHGGMAPTKGRRIKDLLDLVWKEGIERKYSEKVKKEIAVKQEYNGIKKEPLDDIVDEEVDLSLDYIHDLPDDEAREKLTSFDGVGPKTASCVMLFCLQRNSFAVDTHVFRLSRYLGWVPAKATRETTYAHLDVKVPAEHKYALHNLLIRHGRTCQHCKAGPKSKAVGRKRSRPQTEATPDTTAEAPSSLESTPKTSQESRTKLKKVWIGTGMMKEVLVEVPDVGQEGDTEAEKCVLRALVRRHRKPRRG